MARLDEVLGLDAVDDGTDRELDELSETVLALRCRGDAETEERGQPEQDGAERGGGDMMRLVGDDAAEARGHRGERDVVELSETLNRGDGDVTKLDQSLCDRAGLDAELADDERLPLRDEVARVDDDQRGLLRE